MKPPQNDRGGEVDATSCVRPRPPVVSDASPAVCGDSNATLLGIDCASSWGNALISFKGEERAAPFRTPALVAVAINAFPTSYRISLAAAPTSTFHASAGWSRANEAEDATRHVASLLRP